MDKTYNFIFSGRSGCGKGTQVALMKDYLKDELHSEKPVLYVETGHKFRDYIEGTSFSSRRSKVLMEESKFQPSFLAVYMWSSVFTEQLTGDEHIIMDGMPRTKQEAEILETAMDFYGLSPVHFVYLNVSRNWARERLLARGRADDMAGKAIERRLDSFEKEVLPAIEYYRSHGGRYNFIEVNGEQEKEEVHKEIISKIFF